MRQFALGALCAVLVIAGFGTAKRVAAIKERERIAAQERQTMIVVAAGVVALLLLRKRLLRVVGGGQCS